jgi:hypothetical protein
MHPHPLLLVAAHVYIAEEEEEEEEGGEEGVASAMGGVRITDGQRGDLPGPSGTCSLKGGGRPSALISHAAALCCGPLQPCSDPCS